jgi:two-component system phosphate regulon sensor histidine kinase PhoR
LGALVLVKDITEKRRLEGMRKDFVATVSHEFRTPLTLISGFVEMFKTRRNLDPADRARAFEIMEIETERLKRLISELLMLAEMENTLPWQRIDEIDPSAVLSDIGRSLSEMARRKGQRLEMVIELGDARLHGDESWFQRAVYNLVENAIKFSPSGTLVRLTAGIEDPGDSGRIVLQVKDEGPGIPKEELSRIFERFYRVEKSRGSGSGGSGLGLALVKDIAEIFGGSVKVDSEPGRGSVFTLEFPLRPPGTAAVPPGSGDGFGEGNLAEGT